MSQLNLEFSILSRVPGHGYICWWTFLINLVDYGFCIWIWLLVLCWTRLGCFMAGNYVKQSRLVLVSSHLVPLGSIIRVYDNKEDQRNMAEREPYLYKATSPYSNQNGNQLHLTSPLELYGAKQLKTITKPNNNLLTKFTGQSWGRLDSIRFILVLYGSGV